jgi:hypothetical protein
VIQLGIHAVSCFSARFCAVFSAASGMGFDREYMKTKAAALS